MDYKPFFCIFLCITESAQPTRKAILTCLKTLLEELKQKTRKTCTCLNGVVPKNYYLGMKQPCSTRGLIQKLAPNPKKQTMQ